MDYSPITRIFWATEIITNNLITYTGRHFKSKCLLHIWVIIILIGLNTMLTSGREQEDEVVVLRLDEEIYFEVVEPEEIAYTFKITTANNFGTRFNKTIKEVPLVPAQPLYLCSPASNSYELQGNVVLAQRGECSFLTKAINAENSGAKAIIVMDSDIDNDEDLISMQDDDTGRNTYIPAVSLSGKDGYIILKTLAQLKLDYAIINIPINMTGVPLHLRNLPKWTLW